MKTGIETRTRRRKVPGLLLAALLALPLSTYAARDAQALRECMAKNLPAQSFSQDVTMTQTDHQGSKRQLKGSWYWRTQGEKQAAMLRLTYPPDMSGSAYLLLQSPGSEEFYVYLSSLKKMRKVSGASAAQSLFGSGLSAFDLKFLFSGLTGGNLDAAGTGLVKGRPVEKWRYIPPADPQILYDRLDMSIDTVWCLPLEVDLFGGVPWKKFVLDTVSVKSISGRWTPAQATLTDLRQNTTTIVQMRNSRADTTLPDSVFKPASFYKYRGEQ